jgi:hypothetical protein
MAQSRAAEKQPWPAGHPLLQFVHSGPLAENWKPARSPVSTLRQALVGSRSDSGFDLVSRLVALVMELRLAQAN